MEDQAQADEDARVAQGRQANDLQQQPDDFEDADDLEDVDGDQALEALAIQLEHQQLAQDNIGLPPEMILTPEEHIAAWRIKSTIDLHPELDNVSDFMCGTLAIAAEGDVEQALEIATHLQDFRKEYDILDTLEDALRHMKDIIVKPTDGDRFILAMDEDTDDGTFIVACDLPKLDLRNYKSLEQIQRFFKGIYYQSLIISLDFRAVRAGIVNLVECEGYKWKHNMIDLNFMKRLIHLEDGTLPFKIKEKLFFNSPMLVNTMVSMAKSVLPKHKTEMWHMGCRAPVGERMDQLYNIPSKEVAEQRLEAYLEILLRRRFRNEKMFRLEAV